MIELENRLARGEVILLDGATGTELERRGVPMDGVAWSAAAVLTHPEVIQEVHEDYIRAGAEIIITNTFGTSKHVLEPAGMGDQFRQINTQAVRLAQAARDRAAGDRRIYIAGSISTFMPATDPDYPLSPDQLQANYREQAHILAEAGVDFIALEMMRDIEQTTYAVEAALSTGLPVWVGFSCKIAADGTVLLWDQKNTLAEGLEAILPLGGAAVGIMHTLTEDIPPALAIVRQHWAGPLYVYAHSGHFVMPNWQFVNIISPEDYATAAEQWVAAGVQAVGGCCGTGPEHIQELRRRLPSHIPQS